MSLHSPWLVALCKKLERKLQCEFLVELIPTAREIAYSSTWSSNINNYISLPLTLYHFFLLFSKQCSRERRGQCMIWCEEFSAKLLAGVPRYAVAYKQRFSLTLYKT